MASSVGAAWSRLRFSLDHVGPLTRTVRDNALALELIAGYDRLDPGSAADAPTTFASEIDRGVEGLRVGVIRHFYTRDMQADPEMTAGIDAAVMKLADLGARRTRNRDRAARRVHRLQPSDPHERGVRDTRKLDA